MKQVLNNNRFTQLIAFGLTKKVLFILLLSVPLALFSQKSKQNPLVGRWILEELVLDISVDFDCNCDAEKRAGLEEGFKNSWGHFPKAASEGLKDKFMPSYMDFKSDSTYVHIFAGQNDTSTYTLGENNTLLLKGDTSSSYRLQTKSINGRKRQFIVMALTTPASRVLNKDEINYGKVTMTVNKMEFWFALADSSEPNHSQSSISADGY